MLVLLLDAEGTEPVEREDHEPEPENDWREEAENEEEILLRYARILGGV